MTRKDDPTDEAIHARSLAGRLRAIDFADTDPPRGLRALEGALERFAGAREDPGGRDERIAAWSAIADSVAALAAALEGEQRARSVDRMRLAEGLRWVARGTADVERLTARVAELEQDVMARDARVAGLETEMRARDAAMAAASAEAQRVAAGLAAERDAAREETRAGDAGIARLEVERARLAAEVARLEATAAQPGHRFVARMGAILAAHPRLGAALSAMVRGLNRLLGSGR